MRKATFEPALNFKNTARLVLEKTAFSAWASKLNTGLKQRLYGMFFACEVV